MRASRASMGRIRSAGTWMRSAQWRYSLKKPSGIFSRSSSGFRSPTTSNASTRLRLPLMLMVPLESRRIRASAYATLK